MRRPVAVVAVGVVTFGIALGGAWAVAYNVAGDEDAAAEPPVAPEAADAPALETIPILAPVGVEMAGPPAATATVTATPGALGPYAGVAEVAPPASEPDSEAEDAALADNAGPRELTRDEQIAIAASIPAGAAATTPAFVDPCAGAAPGEGSGDESCVGDASTVRMAIVSAQPTWAIIMSDPLRLDGTYTGWRRCEFPDGDGLPVVIVTNNPTSSVALTVRARDAAPGDPGAIALLANTSAPDDPERMRWESAGSYPVNWWANVQHCARIDQDFERGVTYSVVASVTGIIGDDARSAPSWFTGADGRARPPVTWSFDGDTRLTAVVPTRSGVTESAIVVALDMSNPEVPHRCRDYEPVAGTFDVGADLLSYGSGVSNVPPEVVDADDYPYLPAYDRRYSFDLHLEEGTAYVVCVLWTSQPRSFTPTRIHEREEWAVHTPDRLRVEMLIRGADLAGPVDEGSVRIHARDGVTGASVPDERGGICAGSTPPTDLAAGTNAYTEPQSICRSGGHTDGIPRSVVVETRWLDADPYRAVIPLDPTGSPRRETFRVGLTRSRTLCGSSPFGAGDCSHDDLGSLLVEVVYTDGPVSPADEWLVTPLGPWEYAAEPPTRPVEPQVDMFLTDTLEYQSGVVPVAGTTDQLEMRLVPDRDVFVRVFHDATDVASICLHEGAPLEVTGIAPANAPTAIVIGGLCARTPYSLALELTDAEGNRVVYSDSRSGIAGARPWGRSYSQTYGYVARYSSSLWIDTLAYDDMYLRPEAVSVAGSSLGYDRDIDETQRAAYGCESRGTLFQRARHNGRFGETVEVVVDLEATMLVAGRSSCLWTGTGAVPIARATTTIEVPVVALLDGTEEIVATADGLSARLVLREVTLEVG